MADRIFYRFVGGDQFMVEVRAWRARLRSEVATAAAAHANALMQRAMSRYPVGKTGNLRAGVTVDLRGCAASNGDAVQARIFNAANHAWLYEYGNNGKMRSGPLRTVYIPNVGFRRTTKRGAMPAHHTFVTMAIAERAAFMEAVRGIMASPERTIGPGVPDLIGRA